MNEICEMFKLLGGIVLKNNQFLNSPTILLTIDACSILLQITSFLELNVSLSSLRKYRARL